MDSKAQCGDQAAVRPVQATGPGDALPLQSFQPPGRADGDAGHICE